jgi:transposase
MDQSPLFPLPKSDAPRSGEPTKPEHARVLRPNRQQLQWAPRDLDATLAQDHPARAIWDVLEHMDLSSFYGSIKAVLDGPGRPATDPQVLLALWLMATVEGIGSARQLTRLCEEHDAYRWLCGGVPINYHMLSDFRIAKQAALDELLTQIIASLMAAKAVSLERVAQDGMRVRASAGASSFRRKDKLRDCLQQAREQVERLAEAREHPDPGVTKRQQAARERAVRERLERVGRALAYLPKAEETKEKQRKRFAKEAKERITEPRLSTTDPEARVMKMPDGGYRPAFNAQLATDSANGIILGVSVTASGSDAHQAPAMEEQIESRTGHKPESYLMDGGFAVREDITLLEERGIKVYAPVRLPKRKPEAERYEPRYGDSPEVIAWRSRMATEEGKTIYRQRAATAEWANAQARRLGLTNFTVRGIDKVTSVLLLVAVAHNIIRGFSLAAI